MLPTMSREGFVPRGYVGPCEITHPALFTMGFISHYSWWLINNYDHLLSEFKGINETYRSLK